MEFIAFTASPVEPVEVTEIYSYRKKKSRQITQCETVQNSFTQKFFFVKSTLYLVTSLVIV